MEDHDAQISAFLKHRCATCRKEFKNLNHLRRHEVSHTTASSFRCEYCSRSFARNDALRRHFKTCSKVEDSADVPAIKRGRKSRACERCQIKKLRCDGAQPCKRCMSAVVDCSSSVHDEARTASRVPMTFMLNYTNPVLDLVSDAFAISEAHAEPPLNPAAVVELPAGFLHDDDFMADLFSGIFADFDVSQNLDIAQETLPEFSVSPVLVGHRAAELIALLRAQHESMQTKSESPFATSKAIMDLANVVFTSHNLTGFIAAFFQFFHPHTPFIHRATFNVNEVSASLLLGVVLVGSIFCAPQDAALSARYFFGLAEGHVCQLLRQVAAQGDHFKHGEAVEVIQSAVLVHALQVNSNHDGNRRRVRVNCFSDIVAAMRHLGLFSSGRKEGRDECGWEDFIKDEVQIRLAHRVFTTDCMNTLFFKSPPQITIAEMCGALPSTYASFETSNSIEFSRLDVASADLGGRHKSLKDWLNLLLGEGWTAIDPSDLKLVEIEHLMSILFALHSLVFVSRTGLLLPSTYQVLRRATERWKELWDRVQLRDANRRSYVGFAKYGLELWWLARKVVEVSRLEGDRGAYMTSGPSDSLQELHGFIRQYSES
ncbi:hypothetical protein HBI56_145540 [Parastagonospora nodorum]|nr:hypothetical protein HBH53_042120 [Parastagonospora nodorum]KAH4341291.1 hypothetical protein HBH98_176400 [Parastagonospora nodorum]KAH4369348.1 hypothetical protein HBH97_147540 [Parastagonospora nodorum]KAH4387007.1 hypothetical protein HBH99_168370 [Parastagonospora nodorum]KAH4963972.1 hypothetical protein HBI78_112010 [Parastagonospora nodorum]